MHAFFFSYAFFVSSRISMARCRRGTFPPRRTELRLRLRSRNANERPLDDPLSQGLRGYWKLDEGTGTSTTADASGNANTLSMTGPPPGRPAPSVPTPWTFPAQDNTSPSPIRQAASSTLSMARTLRLPAGSTEISSPPITRSSPRKQIKRPMPAM